MAERERLTDPPQPGDYVTDGTRLFEVTGESDSDGNYYLLDCALPFHKDPAAEKVSTHDLWKGYWIVQPD